MERNTGSTTLLMPCFQTKHSPNGHQHALNVISHQSLVEHHLTIAEVELLLSFLLTAAWYMAKRSFTDTGSGCCSSTLQSWRCPDLPALPTAANIRNKPLWSQWSYDATGCCFLPRTSCFGRFRQMGHFFKWNTIIMNRHHIHSENARWCLDVWNMKAAVTFFPPRSKSL